MVAAVQLCLCAIGVCHATWMRAVAGLLQVVVLANVGGRCRNAAQGVFLGASSRLRRWVSTRERRFTLLPVYGGRLSPCA